MGLSSECKVTFLFVAFRLLRGRLTETKVVRHLGVAGTL